RRPADDLAADLRAGPPDRAPARRRAFALRARRRRPPRCRYRGRTRQARRARQARGPGGMTAGGAVGTPVPTGNTFDKYGSTNPVVRRLMAGFQRTLDELLTRAAPTSVLDVGCGEGILTAQWAQRLA